jgi:UDP-2,4-diacetamido-2,4,6-trideoxy-beta-L-altropyranose hydrolase
MNVQIAFRVDASMQMGTGHVMRCLTLAQGLRMHGVNCRFICRNHPGNLIDQIRQHDFIVHVLPYDLNYELNESFPTHAKWIGVGWNTDADQTKVWLGEALVDWLIVDHYGLDARWEREMSSHYHRLMVIDDLADRPHACHLLLDQTFGRDAKSYSLFGPEAFQILCGSTYALLRPEFASLRPYSLQRREKAALREFLITMGGIDNDNITGQILDILRFCQLPKDCRITVVMGSEAPWREEVSRMAESMPWPTKVLVGVRNMAELMAKSDFAIGAAGATSWERCCLGLPTAIVILAENQRFAADQLEKANAVCLLRSLENLKRDLTDCMDKIMETESYMSNLGASGIAIIDGRGCQRVVGFILK